MKPVKFEQSNFTYTAPKGMEDSCDDLPVFRGNAGKLDVVLSAWQPSEEDKKRIADGKPIYLQIVGSGMPPVALFTENPFE